MRNYIKYNGENIVNEQYLLINNIEIPINIKSYRKSKSVKIFFKNDKITITKPVRLGKKNLQEIIAKNEEFIYNAYLKGVKDTNNVRKNWCTGEKIFYLGEEFEIVREIGQWKQVHIVIDQSMKQIKVTVPEELMQDDIKDIVDSKIKKLFKKNTELIILQRLPYWSQVTKIAYNKFTVRDAKTRYGSCVAKTKTLRFSGRLIMLSMPAIDAIIVHELCHIVHANHSKDFYNLLGKYIPGYKEIDKWLKKNGKLIII